MELTIELTTAGLVALTFGLLLLSLLFYLLLRKMMTYFIEKSPYVVLDDLFNAIRYLSRFIITYGFIVLVVFLYQLPVEIIIFLSALVGTIVSLSSIHVLNNFLAGLVIITLRPFGINDLVQIGSHEGIVTGITLNYTRVKNVDGIYMYVPNRLAIRAEVVNYSIYRVKKKDANENIRNLNRYYHRLKQRKLTQYSFQMSVPLGDTELYKGYIEEVFDEYTKVFGVRPTFFLVNFWFKLEYQILVFSEDPELIFRNIRQFRTDLTRSINRPKPVEEEIAT